jgi:hypothetical protein
MIARAAPCWPAGKLHRIRGGAAPEDNERMSRRSGYRFADKDMRQGLNLGNPAGGAGILMAQSVARTLAVGGLVLGLLSASSAPGMAREQSARAFVEHIYALHIGPNEGFGLDSDADYRRWFEPALAAGMIRDARDAWDKRDRARLNHDVFVDSDSWLLTRVNVAVAPVTPRRAIATVTFDNAGVPTMVTLDLVRLRIGWRIRDIHARKGPELGRLL